MNFKRLLYVIIAIGSVVAPGRIWADEQFKIFDNGEHTLINGSDLAEWFAIDGTSGLPSTLEDIIVVECSENGEYGKQFSLAELKRIRNKMCKSDCSQRCVRQMNEKLVEYVRENNAIFCPNLVQRLNSGDDVKSISAIIVGVKVVSHCDSYKKWLAEHVHGNKADN